MKTNNRPSKPRIYKVVFMCGLVEECTSCGQLDPDTACREIAVKRVELTPGDTVSMGALKAAAHFPKCPTHHSELEINDFYQE